MPGGMSWTGGMSSVYRNATQTTIHLFAHLGYGFYTIFRTISILYSILLYTQTTIDLFAHLGYGFLMIMELITISCTIEGNSVCTLAIGIWSKLSFLHDKSIQQ